MIDEPRDDELDDDEGTEQGGDAPEAPRPQTWAGRARAEADEPADEEAATPEPAGEEAHEEADEREEPPDEFEFSEDETDEHEDEDEDEDDAEDEAEPEDDDHAETADAEEPEAGAEGEPEGAEEPDAEGEAEDQSEDKPDAGEKPGQETVEVDTLAISDREAEQEAAHAGLKARAEKTAAHRVATSGAQAAVAGAVASLPDEGAGEAPKRNVWWRFLAASFVVVASTAAATSIAFLLYLTDIGDDLKGDESFERAVAQSLSDVEGGEPQTILILGSDKRTTAPGDPGRSDTTMLLRVDPEKEFLSLLSLPRDLQVEIPGFGTDRLNAAYSYGEQFEKKQGGGSQLTLRTVKDLLGIEINHIVNVNFEGFYDAINAIGCVYIDVDRHYFNPVGGEYDDIDIEAGYTKLCGYRGARLRPLPAQRQRPRPRRPAAVVRARGPPADSAQGVAARVRGRRRVDRHLHEVHDLRHQRRPDNHRDAPILRGRAQRPRAPGKPRRAHQRGDRRRRLERGRRGRGEPVPGERPGRGFRGAGRAHAIRSPATSPRTRRSPTKPPPRRWSTSRPRRRNTPLSSRTSCATRRPAFR